MNENGNSMPLLDDTTQDDIPAITQIYRDAVINGRASFELQPPDEAEMLHRFNDLVANGFPYLVARIDDTVAGYAYAAPYRSRPAYKWVVENSVYIDPGYQKMGLGLLLLEKLIDVCARRDFRQMIAVIGDTANISSIRLHEKAGFVHTGTLLAVGRKHNLWLDTVIMQRQLGSGSDNPPK